MKRSITALSLLLSILWVPSAMASVSIGNGRLWMNAEHGVIDHARIIGWDGWKAGDNPNERFLRDGALIRLKDTKYCIGVDEIKQGAQFYLQPCTNTPNQRFTFVNISGSGSDVNRLILTATTGLCLDMQVAADGSPALVILAQCHALDNQFWWFHTN